jgi:hypothetical protein
LHTPLLGRRQRSRRSRGPLLVFRDISRRIGRQRVGVRPERKGKDAESDYDDRSDDRQIGARRFGMLTRSSVGHDGAY